MPYLAGMEQKIEQDAIPCGKIAALVCDQKLLYLAGMTTINYQKFNKKKSKKSSGQSIGLTISKIREREKGAPEPKLKSALFIETRKNKSENTG